MTEFTDKDMNIYGFTRKKLGGYFTNIGENPKKADIVFKKLYREGINSFSEISEFKDSVKNSLKRDFEISNIKLIKTLSDENTKKFLFELGDKSFVESVLMMHTYGNGLCISTQIGCNMDCAFCESGKLKKVRNLEVFEMVCQVLYVIHVLEIPVSHVVLMGIGEPFDNFKNVLDFIDIITDTLGISIAKRHITVSTSGVVPKIIEFSSSPFCTSLAVSLHAPFDNIRDTLMPINKKYNIKSLLDAVKVYTERTNKKVTFAYIMIKNINDTKDCAFELAKLLTGINCYVNLIPYNITPSSDFKPSDRESISEFFDILKQKGINVTVRQKFGENINAACGQLSSEYQRGM